jgi:hypothetical protein
MTTARPTHRLRKFRFEKPQKIAALMLLFLLAQCLWVSLRQPLAPTELHLARCGEQLWRTPSHPVVCCGFRDGTLALRAAGLPLAVVREFTRTASLASQSGLPRAVAFFLRLPFILAALALGACLWWVTRRLFGNEGGYLSLALYCVMPGVVRAAVVPNNNILAAFGLFAAVYTAIGVSHALQGPPRKWRPRIVLLAIILGFIAAAHIASLELALLFIAAFMSWVAEGRRSYIPALLLIWIAGALFLLFASCGFSATAFAAIFLGGATHVWFSLDPAWRFFTDPANAAFSLALASSLVLYAAQRRSRYFGNTTPLLAGALLMFLAARWTHLEPWLWALPFLIAFVGGVFADILETRWRKAFLWISAALLVSQAALCLASLPAIVR